MTVAMNPSIANTSFHPTCATNGATSAKIPTGATNNTQWTIRTRASVTASAMLVSGARFSGGSEAAAIPKIVTNTMMGSRLPSAAALKGFAGTSWLMNCAPVGMPSAARWITVASAPAADRTASCCSAVNDVCGSSVSASRNPSAMPRIAVAQKNASVRTTRRPTMRRSPSLAMPANSAVAISGITTIVRRLRKSVPTGRSPKTRSASHG